jgi:hypothetical protein
MKEAGDSADEHAHGEPARRAQVLQVGLTYRCRMLREKSP